MIDFSKIETKESPLNTMTDAEIKKHFENYQEQFVNALDIINYMERAIHTKVWHEQVSYLMNNYTIINKKI